MAKIFRFPRPHRLAGLTERARLTQESAALAASDERFLVPHWYPWPDDEEDRFFPFYAVLIILAYGIAVVSVVAILGKTG